MGAPPPAPPLPRARPPSRRRLRWGPASALPPSSTSAETAGTGAAPDPDVVADACADAVLDEGDASDGAGPPPTVNEVADAGADPAGDGGGAGDGPGPVVTVGAGMVSPMRGRRGTSARAAAAAEGWFSRRRSGSSSGARSPPGMAVSAPPAGRLRPRLRPPREPRRRAGAAPSASPSLAFSGAGAPPSSPEPVAPCGSPAAAVGSGPGAPCSGWSVEAGRGASSGEAARAAGSDIGVVPSRGARLEARWRCVAPGPAGMGPCPPRAPEREFRVEVGGACARGPGGRRGARAPGGGGQDRRQGGAEQEEGDAQLFDAARPPHLGHRRPGGGLRWPW